MAVTLTLTDMLIAAGVVIPLACTGMYLSIRMAINGAVKDLKMEVMDKYMQKDTCRQIREECERHRESRRARA